MDMIATILFGVLVTYVVIGLLAGLAFVVVGVARVQPAPVTKAPVSCAVPDGGDQS